jgi:hypothetical protein
MTQELKPKLVRVDEFVAELLEERASSLPPSQKAKANNWLRAANERRASTGTRMTGVWQESPEEKSDAAKEPDFPVRPMQVTTLE